MPAPSIFFSHGSPMLGLADASDPVVAMFETLEKKYETPKAIIIMSAHRESSDQEIEIDVSAQFQSLPDFSGFPKALYQIDYPVKGDPVLAARVASMLAGAVKDLPAVMTQRALIDHGIWIPLMHVFKNPTFPVIPVSLPSGAEARHFLSIGQKLGVLRQEGVWIIGSGGAVHNLRLLNWSGKNSIPDAWAYDFEQWVIDRMLKGEVEELARFQESGPDSAKAHPTIEHYLPMLFTVGAAQKGDRFEILHRGIEYGSLSMLSFALYSELPA